MTKLSLYKYLLLLILVIISISSFAHPRGGAIIYRYIKNNTYEIEVIFYEYTRAIEYNDSIEIDMGDETKKMARLIKREYLPDDLTKVSYITQHTFPGAGVYEISIQKYNRIDGVKNIPESVTIPLSFKSLLSISPTLGGNNSPVSQNCLFAEIPMGQPFEYQQNVTDIDGDSLSFAFTSCLGNRAEPIPEYSMPDTPDALVMNPITGTITWNTPNNPGTYNVAILITEWRDGIKIGQYIQDMSLSVADYTNVNQQTTINKGFLVYPNPANSFINISYPANDFNDVQLITISGINGKRLEQHSKSNNNIYQLDVSSYHNGVYLIEIYTTKAVIRRKVVVF